MLARWSKCVACLTALTVAMFACHVAQAQFGGGGFQGGIFNRVVGGIRIDANGTLNWSAQQIDQQQFQNLMQRLQQADAGLTESGMRFISLKRLNQALVEAQQNNQPISPELAFLGGIQRLEYVIVRPEENDVLLAGFGEGWKVNEHGHIVGATTGAPVLQLEDLLVAFRSVENARSGNGISVSIDPTEQGARQAQELLSQLAAARHFEPALAPQIEQAMGPNVITLTGVPADSRYAQVLAAADHKMKRLSMGLEHSPIRNFPSILEMLSRNDATMSGAPRFWMECNYQPVARSDDGLVWQIRGTGVKTLTEDGFFDKHGIRQTTGRANKFADTWAENMTKRFDELAKAEPVFAELRNVMDMSVIAALIAQENLLETAGLDIRHLTQSESPVSTPSWPEPKFAPAQCSFVAVRGFQNVFVSGGVLVDSWKVVSQVETASALSKISEMANGATQAERLWWTVSTK
ncbi:MAG TPA: DUF1598 domain-containing protein [Pirellulaceae bacterium]|nr:DUF1598 domain-containing protein [Pirellulaceae bacterium]